MRVLLTLIICLSGFATQGSEPVVDEKESCREEISLIGIYRERNLFVQNPFSESGVGFCSKAVKVNGVALHDSIISSSAYEIDLLSQGFVVGDSIHITIEHGCDCKPKVLNSAAISRYDAFLKHARGVLSFENFFWETFELENPFRDSLAGQRTIESIEINGKLYPADLLERRITVDPNRIGLDTGRYRKVRVKYDPRVRPKLLGPQTDHFTNAELISSETEREVQFSWTVAHLKYEVPFVVEHLQAGEWVEIATVPISMGQFSYGADGVQFSGENWFRISQLGRYGVPALSRLMGSNCKAPPITFEILPGKQLQFSHVCRYKLYDAYGNLIRKGFSDQIDLKLLRRRESYRIKYENEDQAFSPKRTRKVRP